MFVQVLVKEEKQVFSFFTENMTKELYVSIIEKRLKEMKTMGGKTLSLHEIMTPNIQVI